MLVTVDCGQSIVRLITAHWNNRQSMSWERKLRVINDGQSASKWNEGSFDPKRMGLTAVDLSQNALRDKGLKVIAEALLEDAGILWMDLRANGMTNCALIDVMKMLKRNTKLLHFDLTQNSGIPQETASEILSILGLRRTQNGSIDTALMPETRDFNAKRTMPRISRTATARPSRRISVKSTPTTMKRKKQRATTSKVPPSRKPLPRKRKVIRKRVVSAPSSRPKRSTKQRAVRAVRPRSRSSAIPKRRASDGINANEILEDILSEYKSTKLQCDKLTKQKKTISQIIDSLESTFNRFNDYIETMERHKVQMEASQAQPIPTPEAAAHGQPDIDTEVAHNVIEHRLRQIWDSRLNQ